MEILNVTDMTMKFGGITAIENLSFEVDRGIIFGIIGPNGSGKTTLFNLIQGFHHPTKGHIVFEGNKITGKKIHQIAAAGISRTFQTTTVFQDRRVAENIFLASAGETFHFFNSIFWRTRQYKKAFDHHKENSYRILQLIGLDKLHDKRAGDLSQEVQKRLAIGMALASNPKILLLDEPTGGIPMEETQGIVELIGKIRELGVTVCLIEHKMKVIMNLAQQILVLNYGRKIAEGAPEEIRNNEEVIKAYLGEDYVIAEGY